MFYNLEVFLASERQKWYPSPSSLRCVSSSETESKFLSRKPLTITSPGSLPLQTNKNKRQENKTKQKIQRSSDLPTVTKLKAMRNWGILVTQTILPENECLFFGKQNNENEKMYPFQAVPGGGRGKEFILSFCLWEKYRYDFFTGNWETCYEVLRDCAYTGGSIGGRINFSITVSGWLFCPGTEHLRKCSSIVNL